MYVVPTNQGFRRDTIYRVRVINHPYWIDSQIFSLKRICSQHFPSPALTFAIRYNESIANRLGRTTDHRIESRHLWQLVSRPIKKSGF